MVYTLSDLEERITSSTIYTQLLDTVERLELKVENGEATAQELEDAECDLDLFKLDCEENGIEYAESQRDTSCCTDNRDDSDELNVI